MVFARPFAVIGALFALVGMLFLGVSLVILSLQHDFARAAIRTSGTVEALIPRGNATYAAQIRFTDRAGQTQTFTESGSSNPPRAAVGDRVTVLYDPASPRQAVVDDLWGRMGVVLIIGPLGLIFTLLGFGMVFYDWRQQRLAAWLKDNGIPVKARFLEVIQDDSVTVNGRHPYRVVAQGRHPLTGEDQRFTSAMVWTDPGAQLQGSTLTVLCHPAHPRRHTIDLSAYLTDRPKR